MILSLDLSTSLCGVTVFETDGTLVLSEAIDLRNKNKYENIYQKAAEVRRRLMIIEHKIEHIYIEKSLMMFTKGRSSISTIILVASFNMLVSWLCYDIFKVQPEYISATTARKKVGILINKELDTKKQVFDFVTVHEPAFPVSYTPQGNPRPDCFDRADSWVVGKAGLIQLGLQGRKAKNSQRNSRV